MKALLYLLSTRAYSGLLVSLSNNAGAQDLKLWYDKPADASVVDDPYGWKNNPEWLKALPLGS